MIDLSAATSFASVSTKTAPLRYASWAVGSREEIKARSASIDDVLSVLKTETNKSIYRRIALLDVAFEKARVPNAAKFFRRWLFGTGLADGFSFNGENMKYVKLPASLTKESKSYRFAKAQLDKKIIEYIGSRNSDFSELAQKAVQRSLTSGLKLPSKAYIKAPLPDFDALSQPVQYLGPSLTQDVSMQDVLLVDSGIIGTDPSLMEMLGGYYSAFNRFKESGEKGSKAPFPAMAAVVGSFRLYGYFTGSVYKSAEENKWFFAPTHFGTRLIDRYAFSGDNEDEDQPLGYWHPEYGHSFSRGRPMLKNGMFTSFRREFCGAYNEAIDNGQPSMKCSPYALVQDMQKSALPDGPPIPLPNLDVTS